MCFAHYYALPNDLAMKHLPSHTTSNLRDGPPDEANGAGGQPDDGDQSTDDHVAGRATSMRDATKLLMSASILPLLMASGCSS
jgi:hypothetical protein